MEIKHFELMDLNHKHVKLAILKSDLCPTIVMNNGNLIQHIFHTLESKKK